VAGIHGAIGLLLALYARDARGGEGRMIDLALYEAIFNLSESLLPEYDVFGEVRQPAGGALPGITPSNAYPCACGQAVLIAADPHYASRGNIDRIPSMQGGTIAAPGIVPRLSATPGRVHHAAPTRGQHTMGVLAKAGISAARLDALASQGVIE